ncbi:helix-turn-helix domain-containing protein [Pollutimonas sp. M17]|uniref:helix-turn-helix domain-containing protein n=1 Tax=Pollutimonas sp. M17 TaxID=2962065 RepID=UPI0021F4335C|nr:helix-turn-helix transcriptional regulator [Pollutimonas sp. M17]UYO93362.1 helix-turn-helix domain-containing protein [Pollutimonas sp. M17]
MTTFGQRVREVRMRYGWTQKELALASGLTQSAIGNYESGQRTEPTSVALIKLAHALKVTPEWLRQGKESAREPGKESLSKDAGAKKHDAQTAWPFHGVSFDDFLALSPGEKRILNSIVETFIRSRLA